MSRGLFFLDSNVLTGGWKPQPNALLEQWIEDNDWLIPVVVIAEIQEGGEACPSSAEKAGITAGSMPSCMSTAF